MATKTVLGRRTPLRSGPYQGTLASADPYDGSPDFLVNAKNGYVISSTSRAGYGARPGFRRLFGGEVLIAGGRGQAVYTHINLDGTTVNFLVRNGHLFRVDDTLSTATDVTPVGVLIDSAITTRVYFASLIGTLMVDDNVNRPWIATDLTATPITGTYIDYDGLGGSWSTVGAPKVYGGAAFVILNQVNGVSRRTDISWCEPGTLSLGWQQPDFDNNWTLSQNEAGVLYALEADNVSLRYLRGASIGAVAGTVGPDLASTATDDSVAFNIGSQSANSIQKFGSGFFFIDEQGRPYFYTPGAVPEPIWEQMRLFVDQATTNYPTTTSIVATAIIEPTLNLYCVCIWSPNPSTQAPPIEWHVFSAMTRKYQGQWSIGPEGTETGIECLGTLVDSAGRSTMIALAEDGYVWAMNALGATPEIITEENDVFICTEDGVDITTEGQAQQWSDDGELPDVQFMTDRLGFDEDIIWFIDQGVVVTLNDMPVRVVVGTSAEADTLEGIPQPGNSADGTYRLPFGCEIMGRGPTVTIKPLLADQQFILQRIGLTGIPSLAGPEDV